MELPFAASIQIGEAFAGEGAEAAHLNTVLGRRGGPFETAWVTALASPRSGHVPFLAVLRPDLPVLPRTLFVNKSTLTGPLHSTLTWGAAQAGVATGVADAVAGGVIPLQDLDDLLLLAAVWVDPEARDEGAVLANNREATRTAIERGASGFPSVDDVLAARDTASNPFVGRATEPG
jgi:5,6,7,8-tetrahydromethanopterin hydro-lyase